MLRSSRKKEIPRGNQANNLQITVEILLYHWTACHFFHKVSALRLKNRSTFSNQNNKRFITCLRKEVKTYSERTLCR